MTVSSTACRWVVAILIAIVAVVHFAILIAIAITVISFTIVAVFLVAILILVVVISFSPDAPGSCIPLIESHRHNFRQIGVFNLQLTATLNDQL